MDIQSAAYNEFVVNGILAIYPEIITAVNDLEVLISTYFIHEQYSTIENFIKAGDIDSLKRLFVQQPKTDEYLEIMMFKDQLQKKYLVTVYDSILLEQDPQIISIYPIE